MNVTQSLKHIDRAVTCVDVSPDEYRTATEEESPRIEGQSPQTEARSPRQEYQRTIEAVREVAGDPEAKQLARWIEDEIRADATLPSRERVREAGATICREAGQPVPKGGLLGR